MKKIDKLSKMLREIENCDVDKLNAIECAFLLHRIEHTLDAVKKKIFIN